MGSTQRVLPVVSKHDTSERGWLGPAPKPYPCIRIRGSPLHFLRCPIWTRQSQAAGPATNNQAPEMRLWASVYCSATLLSWALGVTVDEKALTIKCGCTTETLPHPRIVLVGSTGVGKSTFGNRWGKQIILGVLGSMGEWRSQDVWAKNLLYIDWF